MSDSESSSELEMHDVTEEELNMGFFSYLDPLLVSAIHRAVLGDDVAQLQSLVESGKSVNVMDNNGNTPLHTAILNKKSNAFDFLLKVPGIRLNAVNFEGASPLLVAMLWGSDSFAEKLINKGVDVNLAGNAGYTPLHYTSQLKIAQLLLEKGAHINAESANGATPLYLACEHGETDLIHLLLYYGADATLPTHDGKSPFEISLQRCTPEIQEILFHYTFDETGPIPVNLQALVATMKVNSPLFPKIVQMTSQVIYDDEDLKVLETGIPRTSLDNLRIFLDRFAHVFEDLVASRDFLHSLVLYLIGECGKSHVAELVYLLCGSPLINDIAAKFRPSPFLIHGFSQNVDETTLTKIISCLLSYGVCAITSYDLNLLYQRYGFNELFQILLHMDIVHYAQRFEKEFEEFLISSMIYNFDLDIEQCLANPHKFFASNHNLNVIKFFALPQLQRILFNLHQSDQVKEQIKKLPKVPLLVELSRNSARKFIIEKYKIVNSRQFFTIINWLPISKVHKRILTYEKELYNV